MVKCRVQKCSHVDSTKFQKIYQSSSAENDHSKTVKNQNVYKKFSRMTDGVNKTCENEMKLCTWDGFHNWLYCICVVTFDLELGQALEVRINCKFTFPY